LQRASKPRGKPKIAESLWILNEPFSGMLLAVAAADDEVTDATLHYNLHTDDAGLLRTPFPGASRSRFENGVRAGNLYRRLAPAVSTAARNNAPRSRVEGFAPSRFSHPGEWESVAAASDVARHGPAFGRRAERFSNREHTEGVRSSVPPEPDGQPRALTTQISDYRRFASRFPATESAYNASSSPRVTHDNEVVILRDMHTSARDERAAIRGPSVPPRVRTRPPGSLPPRARTTTRRNARVQVDHDSAESAETNTSQRDTRWSEPLAERR
jgi:hypothetical protein